MNARQSLKAIGLMYCRASSATERARWRIEPTSAAMSWTPPTKIEPSTIQSTAGTQPKKRPARIGPTTGPAPAIDEKWCPSTTGAGVGTKSIPSRIASEGTRRRSSSPSRAEIHPPYTLYARTNTAIDARRSPTIMLYPLEHVPAVDRDHHAGQVTSVFGAEEHD